MPVFFKEENENTDTIAINVCMDVQHTCYLVCTDGTIAPSIIKPRRDISSVTSNGFMRNTSANIPNKNLTRPRNGTGGDDYFSIAEEGDDKEIYFHNISSGNVQYHIAKKSNNKA